MSFELMVLIITNKKTNTPYTKVFLNIDSLVDFVIGFYDAKNRAVLKDALLRSSWFETGDFTFKVDYHHLAVGVWG